MLLNGHFPLLFEYAFSFLEVKTKFFTNGFCITEDLLQFFKSYQVKFFIDDRNFLFKAAQLYLWESLENILVLLGANQPPNNH